MTDRSTNSRRSLIVLIVALAAVLVAFFVLSSEEDQNKSSTSMEKDILEDIPFDRAKWREKEDGDYVYREAMLNDVLYNDTIRSLDTEKIIHLLGKPDREQDNHYYYLITKSSLGSFTMTQTSMVVKFKDDGSIEWIKTHN